MPFLPGLKMEGRGTMRAEAVALHRLALHLKLSSQPGRPKSRSVLAPPCFHPESHSLNSISPAFNAVGKRPGVSGVVLKPPLLPNNVLQPLKA